MSCAFLRRKPKKTKKCSPSTITILSYFLTSNGLCAQTCGHNEFICACFADSGQDFLVAHFLLPPSHCPLHSSRVQIHYLKTPLFELSLCILCCISITHDVVGSNGVDQESLRRHTEHVLHNNEMYAKERAQKRWKESETIFELLQQQTCSTVLICMRTHTVTRGLCLQKGTLKGEESQVK